MRFSNSICSTSTFILLVIPTVISMQEVAAFSINGAINGAINGGGVTNNNINGENQQLSPPPAAAAPWTKTTTQLHYTPPSTNTFNNKQDESTKLYYVPTKNSKNKDDNTKTLFYAPSTDPDYEKSPFSLEKLKSALMGGSRPSVNYGGKMIPIRELDTVNGKSHGAGSDSVIFVVDDDDDNNDDDATAQKYSTTNKDDSSLFFFAKSFTTTIQENTFFGSKVIPSSSSIASATRHNKSPQQVKTKPQTSIYTPNSALSDLPNALGYATSLSVAGLASGMTMAAKTLANGLEHSAKLTQNLESSFVDIAVQMKDVQEKGGKLKSSSSSSTTTFLHDISEQFRHGSEQLKHDFEHKPIPELVQSFLDHASTASSSVFNVPYTTKKFQTPKIASVPAPIENEYYTPFEACNILYHHEMDPLLDKPKALKIMLEHKYIPVGRSQIYRVFKQFKQGKIQEGKKWGERGRPRKAQLV